MSRAIVTVGVSPNPNRLFGPYLERLVKSFRQFGSADSLKVWQRQYPPGSPTHQQVNYGFKVHAILDALERGHAQVLWLDSSCNAFRPIDAIWRCIETDGYVLFRDVEPLGRWSSDHSLATFQMTRDQAMDLPLLCGAIFGFDFSHPMARMFVEHLRAFATPEHFNGTHTSRMPGMGDLVAPALSTDPRYQGHRSDEVYMSLLAHTLCMRTHHVGPGSWFIGDQEPGPEACIRSGYNLPVPPMLNGPLDDDVELTAEVLRGPNPDPDVEGD